MRSFIARSPVLLSSMIAAVSCGGAPATPGGGVAAAGSEDGPSRGAGEASARARGEAPPPATTVASLAEPTAPKPGPSFADVPTITATSGYEKIRQKPDWDSPIIGLFRAGQQVPLKTAAPLPRSPGLAPCAGGWYQVLPRGYVCLGPASTLAKDDVRAAAAAEVLPDLSAALPFKVGVSTGAPRYLRIPTRAEQRATEKDLDAHLARLASPPALSKASDKGAVDATPAGVGPTAALLRYQASLGAASALTTEEVAFAGMKVAWAREFDAEGRTFLVTPDLHLVPKDRVRVKKTPELAGVDLRKSPGFALPLAFLWVGEAPRFVKDERGQFVPTGETWPRHGFVPVTETTERGKNGYYLRTRDGHWLRRDLATILRKEKTRPKGIGPKEKWVSAKITHGTVVAYEGDTPVYATAMSPGQHGIQPKKYATKQGRHTIGWKMASADMDGADNGADWFVDEVPFVAYYKDSYALHGAWWHDDFGRPKSHGCINLAPADARFFWSWMDPAMPEGWYAVTSYYPHVKGTQIDVKP